jgi:hypothetical protein
MIPVEMRLIRLGMRSAMSSWWIDAWKMFGSTGQMGLIGVFLE